MADTPSITLPKRAQDLTGRRFGKLVALSYAGRKGMQSMWLFACDCGVEKVTFATNVLRGLQKSCGCARTEAGVHKGRVLKNKSEYFSYRNMLARCLEPTADGYENYGGRGVKICDRWIDGADGHSGFTCFLLDMGKKPSLQHTIDRIESGGNYELGNCRWATAKEQQNNRRNNRAITANGITKNITQWASDTGLSTQVIGSRIKRGWHPDIAVTKPVKPR